MKTILLAIGLAAATQFRPIPGSNPWHKTVAEYRKKKETHPQDYFVPNFGDDDEIEASMKNLKAADKDKKWKYVKPKDGPPKDYFVPDFGIDTDILDTQENIKNTEKKMGKTWTPV